MTASLKNLVYSSLGPWFKFSMLPCNLGFEQSNTLPLSQKVKKYSKAISGLHSVRGGSFHRRSFFRQQICAISRYRNTNWITNVKQNIINAQNELRFFRDYHNHSKDIVKIIKSSFGRNSGILGDCKLTLGLIQIHRPKEPEIADIGPARDHLRDGYAEVWGLKAKAESDADHVLLEIEKVKINFESRIINEIERETERTHSKLVRKTDYSSSLSDLFQGCYYDDLTSEIFHEIEMRKQGKQPRKLYPGFSYTRIQDAESKEQTISVYRLSFEQEGAVLISIKEDDKDDIKSRIEKLLLDANLSNLISQYIELKKRLDTNRNRNEFFDKIDGLYKKIYLEGESLDRKGKCILCPQEPL